MGGVWDVEVDDETLDDHDANGRVVSRRRLVQLHSDAEQPVTLIHELLHAVEVAMWEGEEELEETQVHNFARGLASILADNPDLTAWIVSKLQPVPRRARAG
jgi:hypothetical protein